ncbi:MAG TPA: transporter [Caldimonas sp.]|nr:transporter [Caldimonas sp.]HEX2542249.1 transporter [Caldimonas sp.]
MSAPAARPRSPGGWARRRRRLDALRVAAGLLAAPLAAAQSSGDGPAAVPYRPSVSTPAALTAPGWIEIEAGLQHDRAGPVARRDSLPLTAKLAFTDDWGVRLGADAWVRQRDDDGARERGYGDTSLVLKRRFAVDEAQAFGLEASVVLATARKSLGSGSGKTDLLVNAIYSADLGPWHADLNLGGSRLGAAAAGTSRHEILWAAAASRALDERWGVVGELAGAHRRGERSERQFLLAASYSVSPRLVLDIGAARSLRSGGRQWSAFGGVTWLAARLF